jgi:hypothetical protein
VLFTGGDGEALLYVDGALAFRTNLWFTGGDVLSSGESLTVGGRSDLSSARMFGGLIRDLRIHDVALTAEEAFELCEDNMTPGSPFGPAPPNACVEEAGMVHPGGKGVWKLK